MMNDELCRENNLNEDELEKVSGGNGYYYGNWKSVRANVVPGTFLALRSQACYDDGNILVKIQPGEIFSVNVDEKQGNYIWGSAHGVVGWVDSRYISFF
ncbi:MAG: hypothetical protein IKE58_12640 [Blautia sp.]|nr:hypothetical protein [Blautia sp.]